MSHTEYRIENNSDNSLSGIDPQFLKKVHANASANKSLPNLCVRSLNLDSLFAFNLEKYLT